MPHADDIVDRLVSIHGEEGVCPTADHWRVILAMEGNGSIHILNLLRFKSQVDTPNGPISGLDAYGRYSSGVAGAGEGDRQSRDHATG